MLYFSYLTFKRGLQLNSYYKRNLGNDKSVYQRVTNATQSNKRVQTRHGTSTCLTRKTQFLLFRVDLFRFFDRVCSPDCFSYFVKKNILFIIFDIHHIFHIDNRKDMTNVFSLYFHRSYFSFRHKIYSISLNYFIVLTFRPRFSCGVRGFGCFLFC